jgi:syntaxin 1B/2/3
MAVQRITSQLDELVAGTSELSTSLKKRIKVLERLGGSGRDGQIRKQQTALVKSKFVEAIQSYQTVEQQYRTKYKQRLERQYKIGVSRRTWFITACSQTNSQTRCDSGGSARCCE